MGFFLDMTEEEKLIADLGKPKLGDKNTIRIRIRESKEFKVRKKNQFSVFINL
jgi:hypothetical protein